MTLSTFQWIAAWYTNNQIGESKSHAIIPHLQSCSYIFTDYKTSIYINKIETVEAGGLKQIRKCWKHLGGHRATVEKQH